MFLETMEGARQVSGVGLMWNFSALPGTPKTRQAESSLWPFALTSRPTCATAVIWSSLCHPSQHSADASGLTASKTHTPPIPPRVPAAAALLTSVPAGREALLPANLKTSLLVTHAVQASQLPPPTQERAQLIPPGQTVQGNLRPRRSRLCTGC